jgi:SAM-dependent methyltransferase
MSSAPEPFDPLDVPFDQYQRYRITADVARTLADGAAGAAAPRVLDVGGHHTDPWGRPRRPIRDFLPELPTITLDVTANPLAGFVRGRGDLLPFKDGSFDLACSVDVLEHVPPQARPLVLSELTRVASRAIVLAAPFQHRDVERAERLVADFVHRTCGYVQGQLAEHRENGLPDLAGTAAGLAAGGWSVRLFPFGNLWRWALMMLDKHAVLALPGGRALHGQLDRHYNEAWFESDRARPCYRHFLLATASPDDALLAWAERMYGAVTDPARLAPETTAAEADRLFELLALHAENQSRQAAGEPIRREAHLAELEAQRAEQQRHYEAVKQENARLEQLLRDVERSTTYRVGAALRRFGRPGR